MSVYFKARKSNVSNAQGENLYYPQLVNNSTVGIDDIAREIEQMSAASRGDVMSVLTNLSSVMKRAFLDGRSVHIPRIGSFSMVAKCSGQGVKCASDVSAQQINNVHVRFREEQKRSDGKTKRVLTDGIRFVKGVEY